MVLESFQASTCRLCQSMMATRYRKPFAMGIVGDVRGPDLVDPINLHSLQQIGKDPVSRRWFAGVGTPVDGFQTHQPHQPSNPFSAH